jgi:hypothetical protein
MCESRTTPIRRAMRATFPARGKEKSKEELSR